LTVFYSGFRLPVGSQGYGGCKFFYLHYVQQKKLTKDEEMATEERKIEISHDALQERAERLVALLKDRQVGLGIWHVELNESLKEFHDLLCPLFPSQDKRTMEWAK
jgi:DNA gyrase/topoisomerase IV subunit A